MIVQNYNNIQNLKQLLDKNIKSLDLDNVNKNFIINLIFRIFLFVLLSIFIHYISKYLSLLLFSTKVRSISKFSDKSHNVTVYTYMGKMFYVLFYIVCMMGVSILSGVDVATVMILIFITIFVFIIFIQGTISDIFSGILLSIFQTYDVGDYVKIDNIKGQVVDFRSTNTIIENVSTNELITIPNKMIHESKITNYSKATVFVYSVEILLSNDNKNFKDIIKIINDDLQRNDKYPYVKRTDGAKPLTGIKQMEYGTLMLIRIPLHNAEALFEYGIDIKTKIRQLLSDHNIILMGRPQPKVVED